MKFKQPAHGKIDLTPGLRKAEKMKLILMGGGAVLVALLAVFGLSQAGKYAALEGGDLPEAVEAPEEVVYRPEVDTAKLEDLVSDGEGAERAMLEAEAVEELMRSARQMTGASYRDPSIGARELGAGLVGEITVAPSSFRGEPFYARGWIESLEERGVPGSAEKRWLGRLILEDQSNAYFVVTSKPENLVFGSFARVDGLFLKMYSDEDPAKRGRWVDGPLLVGRELTQSYPAYGPVAELDPYELGEVVDDDVLGGISGLPFDALWYLMSYARDLPADGIDWEAAPELTLATLSDLLIDGETYRYQAVKLPVSSLQSVSVKRATENPARLETYTEGWIGNTTWKHVVKFLAPASYEDLRRKDLVNARGIFFKNFAYEPRDGGLHLAPVLIITDMEYYERPSSEALNVLAYIIAGSAIGLLIFLSYLLTRDKRSSDALQSRLTARRRARRQSAPA